MHSHDKDSAYQAKDLVLFEKCSAINIPKLEGKMVG
jgi:hypothetical protein